jgi:Dehydrogenases with different specificities (related to short-chain alcohol dehydrogenases)
VTGGSKGLGKAMARALAKAGASVAISSNDDELRSTAAEIAQESHAKVVPLAAEMTHRGEVKRLAEQAIAALGKATSSSITREGTRRSRSIRSPTRFGITSSS